MVSHISHIYNYIRIVGNILVQFHTFLIILLAHKNAKIPSGAQEVSQKLYKTKDWTEF